MKTIFKIMIALVCTIVVLLGAVEIYLHGEKRMEDIYLAAREQAYESLLYDALSGIDTSNVIGYNVVVNDNLTGKEYHFRYEFGGENGPDKLTILSEELALN